MVVVRSSPSTASGHGVVAERDPVAGADLVARLAVGAGEVAVERVLESGQGAGGAVLARGAEETDQVGRHVARGVGPHRVAPGREALVAELLGGVDDVGGQGRGHLAGDVLEPAVLDAQPLEGAEVVDVQTLGEEGGDLRRAVGGHQRVGHHHQPVDRVGERLAVAVQDVAARRRQHHVDRALVGRHLRIGLRVDALELHQAGGEQREHHRDQQEADPEPDRRGAPEPPAPPTPSGARGAGTSHGWSPHRSRVHRRRSLSRPWSRCPHLGFWSGPSPVPTPSRVCAEPPRVSSRIGSGSSSGGRAGGGAVILVSLSGVAGATLPLTLPVSRSRNAGAERDHQTLALGGLGHPLRVTQPLQLHLQGLLPGGQAGRLILQRGGREGRLLHRGVEQQQTHDPAEQQQADQGHERDSRCARASTRDDGQPGPLDAASASRGRRERSWGAVLLITLLLSCRVGSVRSRAAAPRRPAGWRRSPPGRPSRRRG